MLLSACCGLLSGCFDSPPQIIALQPSRGSVGVPADSPIVVQFDRPVVRGSVVGRFDVTPPIAHCDLTAAFSASKRAVCSIRWLSGDTGFVLSHPGAVLSPDQQYKFVLRGGFADPAGDTNTVDHQWQITTGSAPLVRSISPPDGAGNVPGDLPIAVTFSSDMAPTATEAAITLTPQVPGSQVMRSPRDHTRFLLFPGSPLAPGVTYTVNVGPRATDAHGQSLAAPVSARFTAGGLSPDVHAVVLARRPGEPASEVFMTTLATAAPGDPVLAQALLVAPRCPGPARCGAIAPGAPLYTYSAAVLSPNSATLAVVEHAAGATSPGSIAVIDAASRAVMTVIPDAMLPSWSPDSSTLAFARGASVALYRPATDTLTKLPDGDPLLAPAVWGPTGELLGLSCGGPVERHVELADAVVPARYAVPGINGPAGDPAFSPEGTQLALFRPDAAVRGTWLTALDAPGAVPARRLDPDLVPLGWSDPGTLLGLTPGGVGAQQLVLVSVAGDVASPVTPAVPSDALASLSVAPSGRLVAFLSRGALGTVQAEVQNVGGGAPLAVTAFLPGALEAQAVTLS